MPDQFFFTDLNSVDPSTQYTSNTITVSGTSLPVSITGGTYSKNGAPFTSAPGTAVIGDTFAVRQTSSSNSSTATITTLTIGGVSETYTTTTATVVLAGAFPAAFLNTPYSSSLTISGGTAPYTYTLVSGSLPTGLSLAIVGSNLVLSGTPTVGGSYTFAVKVTDNLGAASNTVTTTGMIVNVFAAPTFSAMMGRRNRARTGAILGGYLGDISTYASDLTIASGNGTGHWQLQNQVIGGQGFPQQAVGLAPRGNPSNNWMDAWPGTSGGALANSYAIVVQHTATGQQCTINVNCNPATTKTWNDRTYNLGNAFVIATEYECRNFGTTGPNNFITRNANEGGWLILRDGVFLGSSQPTFANFWIGEGNFAAGSVAFNKGTFSKNNTVEGNSIFQATHGDGVSGRIVEGWTGGNWTLVSPETPFGAKVCNMQANLQGLLFAQVELITPANNATTFGLKPRNPDFWADCCKSHCEPNPAAGNKFGIIAAAANPYPNMTATNCYFYDVDNAFQVVLMDMYAAGNFFELIRSDCINGSADPGSTAFTGTANCWVAFNILANANVAAGAHPDFFQHYYQGSGGLIPPGVIIIEKNMGLTSSQFVYGAGGTSTTNFMTVVDRNNMNMSGTYVWSHTSTYAQQYTGTCNTTLQDFNGPDYDAANRPGCVVGLANTNVNVTYQDNAAMTFASQTVTGTLIMAPSTNTVAGNNALLTASNAAYANYFNSAMGSGSGGLPVLTANVHSWQAAWNLGFPYFVPKNALAGAGGLKRADGTGPGAVMPGSTASAPLWNVNGALW